MRLNSELIETDRLKTEFIEAASHELRGPVTAVNTAIQVMDNNLAGELSAQGRELVSIARTGSRRLVDLVNNLLDLTRIEAGGIAIEREEVNVGEIVNDTVKIFTPLAGEKGLRIDVDIKGADLEARLDAEALKRVLENLVSNAIKYTDEGSISVGVDATGEALEFTVRDTGRGIPARFQEDVFQEVFTAAPLDGLRRAGRRPRARDKQGPRGEPRRTHLGGEPPGPGVSVPRRAPTRLNVVANH